MLIYQTGNQIYHQVLVLRSCSKVNLRHATSLGFGLKEVKIDLNMVKFCVHGFLPNGNLNLWLNFNSENWSKVKLDSAISLRLGLKGVKIAHNVMKVGVHACLSNGTPKLLSYFNYEKLLKIEFYAILTPFKPNPSDTDNGVSPPLCVFTMDGFKKCLNNFEHGVLLNACLSTKWSSKSMIKF